MSRLTNTLHALTNIIEQIDALEEKRKDLVDRAATLMTVKSYSDNDLGACKLRIKKKQIEVQSYTRRGYTTVRVWRKRR